MKNWLVNCWYQSAGSCVLLKPLAWLYQLTISIRRVAYQRCWLNSYPLTVPVVIVGNISVGGTGKTPLVLWLARQLTQLGWHPGIISRGYGGKAPSYPLAVGPDTPTTQCGDEPKLLALQSDCPVVVAPDRIAAAEMLLRTSRCDVIISDDGLQHYRLQRDIEIVVIDAERSFGNGHCLPAGPLREPVSRLNTVDFVIHHGNALAKWPMRLDSTHAVNLLRQQQVALKQWQSQTVHAVAGIGNPERFFRQLKALGLTVIPHVFADHHRYQATDLAFDDDLPVLMTEKDAVKCRDFAKNHFWSVPAQVILPDTLAKAIANRLKEI